MTAGRLDPSHPEHPLNWPYMQRQRRRRRRRRQQRQQRQQRQLPSSQQEAAAGHGHALPQQISLTQQQERELPLLLPPPLPLPLPPPPPPLSRPASLAAQQWAAPVVLPFGPMQSGVAAAAGSDPAMTFQSPRLSATLDHIFATPRLLRAVGWYAMPWDVLRAAAATLRRREGGPEAPCDGPPLTPERGGGHAFGALGHAAGRSGGIGSRSSSSGSGGSERGAEGGAGDSRQGRSLGTAQVARHVSASAAAVIGSKEWAAALEVAGLLTQPEEAMPWVPWLPSKDYPSDHIEIGVEYQLV
jgi:hypothetical protein